MKLYREDVITRLSELTDPEYRLYQVYVSLANFKTTPDRTAGVVDVTYEKLLLQPMKTWSQGKLSRVRTSLIHKGLLGRLEDSRHILVYHYCLYTAKDKDVELIFQLMKPGILLTEQDVLAAKQKPIAELKQATQDLAKKLTIPNNDVS